MTLNGDAVDGIAELARAGTDPTVLEPGRVYAFLTADGQVEVVDLVHGEWARQPERRTGTVDVDDVDSFVWLFKRWADPDTCEVYASRDTAMVTAVLDSHSAADPAAVGWREHTLRLRLRRTAAWQEWLASSGKMFEQRAFAEFVEDHLADVVEPSAAHMLEVAQTLQGQLKVDWRAVQVLRDGTRQLSYVESTTAEAGGAGGSLKVPDVIKLGLKPFEGLPDRYEISGRFRYQLNGGRLQLGVKLLGLAETEEAAMAGVVGQVSEKAGVTVLWGRP